jgi:hypothetical protein
MIDSQPHHTTDRTRARRPAVLATSLMLLVIAVLATGCAGQGGSDADQQRLIEERVSRERADAATAARQEQRVKELERQVRAASRDRKKRSTRKAPAAPAAAPSTPSIQSPTSGEAPAGFNTGISGGEAIPAAYCRFESPSVGAGVYCWTPNDGYTLRLDASGARRMRGDEAGNRRALPAGYTELPIGSSRSLNGYSCTSRGSGLTCTGPGGSGWVLPRYRGLPQLF